MSLLPTKHSHPDKTIIAISTVLIKKLKKSRIEKYDTLLDIIQKRDTDAKYLFISAVNFLFLMDLIIYHAKTDSFEYIGLWF